MRRPGPVGRSCLTCRKRRKKCDQARPSCERCQKSNFECLGYDCNDNDERPESSASGILPRLEPSRVQRTYTPEGTGPYTYNTSATTSPSILFDTEPSDEPEVVTELFSPVTSESFGSISQLRCQSTSLGSGNMSSQLPGSNTFPQLSPRTMHLLVSLPPNVSWIPSDIADMTSFFMARFNRLMCLSFFRMSRQQILRVRDTVVWRLQNFASTRWMMLTTSKLFDSLATDTPLSSGEVGTMLNSISRIEQAVLSAPTQSLSPAEAQIQVHGSLELGLFKLRMSDMESYTLLRNYAPTFVKIVYSDPSYWSGSSGSTAIPLARILASNTYDVSHFVMLDMMCALAYGLPQLVEYDTSIPPVDNEIRPAEFVHGCPPQLRMIFSDLNVLASWNRIGPKPDWNKLEKRLHEWKPDVSSEPGYESWKLVVRLAIQECWRNTLLIYLYLAVDGASSDEPRVVSSVQQVFRIIGAVEPQLPRIANAHFFVQLLIAGAFSPLEKHRALAHAKLVDAATTRFWFLNMSWFLPVLSHLWHGAAANGRAIRWSDYVQSRCELIPVETWV